MKNSLKITVLFLAFLLFATAAALDASQELPFYKPDIYISMDFQNASLKDILKILSIQSGLNFVASEAVKDRSITLYFDKVPLKEAMDKLFKANHLSYDLDPEANIFIVKDWGTPEIELTTKVFYLKYSSVSSSHILEEVENNISSASKEGETTSTTETTTSTSGSTSDRYSVAEDIGITKAIKKLLSQHGSVIEDYRTNSLIVQDIPSRIPMIARVIADLDVPMPQVLIEVEMLDVSKGTVDKLGIKFGQTPFTMVWTGPKFTGGRFPFAPDWIGGATAAKTLTPGTVDFSTASYTVLIDFLKTQSDTKYLARPRILTLNNETAEFKIVTQETIDVTSTTVSQGTNPVTSQDIQREETGVTLRVTPQVNTETGEITMFIMPTVKDTNTSTLSTTTLTIKDPEERTTKSIVRINDGDTVILGGLIRNQRSETITKLPFLGDIPFVGSLFRHKNKDKDIERELLVFITPHIVESKGKGVNIAKAEIASDTLDFPQAREQDTVSGFDRQAIINRSLSEFETR